MALQSHFQASDNISFATYRFLRIGIEASACGAGLS